MEETGGGQVGARDHGLTVNLLLSFALGRDSVFDICTRQVGEGVENVAGLLAGSGPFLGTKRDPL